MVRRRRSQLVQLLGINLLALLHNLGDLTGGLRLLLVGLWLWAGLRLRLLVELALLLVVDALGRRVVRRRGLDLLLRLRLRL